MPSRTIEKRIPSILSRTGVGVGALALALATAPAALAASATSATDTASPAPLAGAAAARSAPFTIGLSARTVKPGSRVTVSGLANARAGTPLTILSNAISSSRLVGGVPAIRTPAFVEGTYRATFVVPPATKPGTYAITLRANGKRVASTSIAVTARSGGSPTRPSTRTGCSGIGFTVLHNDQSGGVKLPAGGYTVASPNLDCSTASADFTTFLNKYNGAIPGWTGASAKAGRGTFTQRGTGKKFTVTHTR
jgi:hypothetical protein